MFYFVRKYLGGYGYCLIYDFIGKSLWRFKVEYCRCDVVYNNLELLYFIIF